MNADMLVNFPEAARALIESRPIWATTAFAIAVFAGFIGDIMLLLKKSLAYNGFVASFLGVIITNIHTINVSSANEILVGSFMSFMVSGFLIFYAKLSMAKKWIG